MGVPGFCHEEPVIEGGIVGRVMLFGFVNDCMLEIGCDYSIFTSRMPYYTRL